MDPHFSDIPPAIPLAMPVPAPAEGAESFDTAGAVPESVEASVMAATVRYFQAKSTDPDRADAAMRKELQGFLDLKFFKGVKLVDITVEERKFILPSLDSLRTKYDGDGEFIKDKARIFANGHGEKDEYVFESSSPVARIQSVFTLAAVGAHLKCIMFTVDVIQAYPTTPRPEYVRYRFIKLSKPVAALLCKMDPTFEQFLEPEGTMIVEMMGMLYGQKEAGYEFYIMLFNMLSDVKFAANPKDPCLVHRLKSAKKFAHGACTVDDAMWAVSDEDERASVLQMYADKFGPNGFTVHDGLTETAGVCALQHIQV
jgi:hypothetical protein